MMVRRFILSVAMVALVATVASGQNRPVSAATCDLPHASGVSSQQLTSGQRQRAYRLFVPPGYDGRSACRWCSTCTAAAATRRGRRATAASRRLSAGERFLVATLEGRGQPLERAGAERPRRRRAPTSATSSRTWPRGCAPTRSRVYMTGFSGGGRMTSLAGVPARLAPRRGRARLGLALARPLRRPSRAGADLPRAGRSAEPLRRPRRGQGSRVGGERARGAGRLGAPQRLPWRGDPRRPCRARSRRCATRAAATPRSA